MSSIIAIKEQNSDESRLHAIFTVDSATTMQEHLNWVKGQAPQPLPKKGDILPSLSILDLSMEYVFHHHKG